MALDINDQRLAIGEATHTFDLLHYITGEDTGAKLTVWSNESASAKAMARKHHDEDVSRMAAAQAAGKDRPDPLSLDERNRVLDDIALSRLAGWVGVENAGNPLACDESTTRALFRRAPWVRDAVLSEASHLGNFIKPLPTPSTVTPSESSDSANG